MPDLVARDQPVLIWTGRVMLDGRLTVRADAPGVVVVAGLGGTWHHPGCRTVASVLNDHGFDTIISDLLTPDEQQFDVRTGHFRVDLPFLAHRVADIVEWVERNEATRDLPVAYFGSSAAGIAGLLASENGVELFGLVLNAVRPDMVDRATPSVPALLLVDDDTQGRKLAAAYPTGSSRDHCVITIKGSTGLMEPSSTLDAIARHTCDWLRHRVPQLATA